MNEAKQVAARCVAALTLVILMHLEVWLLFATGVGIAAYPIRRFWLHAHRWQPVRVAATALALARSPQDRPSGTTIGILSSARPRWVAVKRASHILHDQHDDLDWGVTIREIVLADELIATLAADPRRNWVPVRLVVWGTILFLAVVLALPIGVFIAGYVGALIAVMDRHEQRSIQPMLLATKALRAANTVPVASPPAESRLALLAGSRTIIDRAARCIDRAALTETERQGARDLLHDAGQLVPAGRSTVDTVVHHTPELAVAAAALVVGW